MDDSEFLVMSETVMRTLRPHGFICLVAEGTREGNGIRLSGNGLKIISNLGIDADELSDWLRTAASLIDAGESAHIGDFIVGENH